MSSNIDNAANDDVLVESQSNNTDGRASNSTADNIIVPSICTSIKTSEDDNIITSIESSDSASLIQQEQQEPFGGKFKLDKVIKINNENKTEYHYFGEIKITGEDSLIIKSKLNIEFYFALQVWNEKSTRVMILEIRQGYIFCNNWILLMCFREPDNSDRCSIVFISLEWFQENRTQLNTSGCLFIFIE
jgi:hypothetical protein